MEEVNDAIDNGDNQQPKNIVMTGLNIATANGSTQIERPQPALDSVESGQKWENYATLEKMTFDSGFMYAEKVSEQQQQQQQDDANSGDATLQHAAADEPKDGLAPIAKHDALQGTTVSPLERETELQTAPKLDLITTQNSENSADSSFELHPMMNAAPEVVENLPQNQPALIEPTQTQPNPTPPTINSDDRNQSEPVLAPADIVKQIEDLKSQQLLAGQSEAETESNINQTDQKLHTSVTTNPDTIKTADTNELPNFPAQQDDGGFEPFILSQSSVDAQMEKVIDNIVELGGCQQFVNTLNQCESEIDKEKEVENIQREIVGNQNSVIDSPGPDIVQEDQRSELAQPESNEPIISGNSDAKDGDQEVKSAPVQPDSPLPDLKLTPDIESELALPVISSPETQDVFKVAESFEKSSEADSKSLSKIDSQSGVVEMEAEDNNDEEREGDERLSMRESLTPESRNDAKNSNSVEPSVDEVIEQQKEDDSVAKQQDSMGEMHKQITEEMDQAEKDAPTSIVKEKDGYSELCISEIKVGKGRGRRSKIQRNVSIRQQETKIESDGANDIVDSNAMGAVMGDDVADQTDDNKEQILSSEKKEDPVEDPTESAEADIEPQQLVRSARRRAVRQSAPPERLVIEHKSPRIKLDLPTRTKKVKEVSPKVIKQEKKGLKRAAQSNDQDDGRDEKVQEPVSKIPRLPSRTTSSRVTLSTSTPSTRPDNRLKGGARHEDSSKKHRCIECNYSTDRLDNIVYHKHRSCEYIGLRQSASREALLKHLQSPKGNKKSHPRY